MNGNIIVEVTSEAMPIPGANVEIFSWRNGSRSNLVTNAGGHTPALSVQAPATSAGLDPWYPGNAYSLYNVAVSAPGYTTVMVEGVQVFSGITSILPVHLTETPDMARSGGVEIISIPPSVLNSPADRTPASEPEEMAGRIQQRVFIPASIRVHLGSPNAAARNVIVSFPDYIKNVASSEIYPTWPESALRANIYAQIGFALNRVYTEWYPSRGYDFDITNSTSYDQFFVHGRNIFENISRIVDEIFMTYPRRAGQLQPLFTSFCNGTTATCAGLSQWGTVTLANDGYSPLEILRYYYGRDTELAQAEGIQGIQSSYPGTPLRLGSRGDDVRTLQRQLRRISRNYPIIPYLGAVDGIFGEKTQAAVKAFQRQFNLTPDGIVGPATWNRISYIYTAVKGLAELDSEGEYPDGYDAYPGLLRQGSRGPSVFLLQEYLSDISRGYSCIPQPAIDGIFGPGTLASVRAFQARFGLDVDGLVGPKTWAMLTEVWRNLQ